MKECSSEEDDPDRHLYADFQTCVEMVFTNVNYDCDTYVYHPWEDSMAGIKDNTLRHFCPKSCCQFEGNRFLCLYISNWKYLKKNDFQNCVKMVFTNVNYDCNT